MLKIKLITYICLLFSCTLYAENNNDVNVLIKSKLKAEADGLQKDLTKLNASVTALKKDKLNITQQLRDMQGWGNSQQSEKLHYYELANKFKDSLSATETLLADEKKNSLATIEKYHRVKKIMSLLAGGFLVLIYFRIGASALCTLAGPYSQLVYFLGPAAAFACGYGTIYLFF
jgi:hypothetical protein